mgnify:CR=1 FL=1
MLNKKIVFFVLLFVCSAFTNAEEGTNTPEAPTSPSSESTDGSDRVGGLNGEQLEQLALSEEVKPKELVWLKVTYPEQDEPVNVLALEQKPRVAKAQGAVLILHDKEQHADWPYFIRPLRLSLPDAGWHTLSVNLPYENAQKFPERGLAVKISDQIILTDQITSALQIPAARKEPGEIATEQSKGDALEEISGSDSEEVLANEEQETQNNENVDIDLAGKNKAKKTELPYKERALLHVNAAIDYLRGEGYQNVIIVGYRSGADSALDYIKPNVSQIPKRGFALVMVDPVLQNAYQTELAEFFGNKFKAPILDIVNGANLEGRQLAHERAIGARIAEIENYHQVSLTVNQNGAFQQSLIRRIRFWLDKYAPGMAATKVSSRR